MCKMFDELFNNLEDGQKITLVGFGEFGFLGVTQTTFKDVFTKPRYQNCPVKYNDVVIRHQPKRKRTMFDKRMNCDSPVIIFNGWVDIDKDKIMYNQLNEFTRETKYTCFDKRYFTDVENSLNVKPIIKINLTEIKA